MNIDRRLPLIELVDSYLPNLSESNLYKLLDLLRNTEERANEDRSITGLNVPIKYTSDHKKYTGNDEYISEIIKTIITLKLDTAHYGILVSNIFENIQINFGVANKFDARILISPSIPSTGFEQPIMIGYGDSASITEKSFFPQNVFDGLTHLVEIYNK